MIAQPEYNIIISPIGDIDTGFFKPISKEVNRIFGYDTETITLLQNVDFALDPSRDQYHSTLILEKLSSMAPPQAVRVVAITKVDLFIPILTYVYGEAQLGGRSCIISTQRLNEDLSPIVAQETFRDRVVKEAIHELGHTFKLRHCPDHTCIMHYCRTAKDVDMKSDQLCRYCSVLLQDEIKRLAENDPSALQGSLGTIRSTK